MRSSQWYAATSRQARSLLGLRRPCSRHATHAVQRTYALRCTAWRTELTPQQGSGAGPVRLSTGHSRAHGRHSSLEERPPLCAAAAQHGAALAQDLERARCMLYVACCMQRTAQRSRKILNALALATELKSWGFDTVRCICARDNGHLAYNMPRTRTLQRTPLPLTGLVWRHPGDHRLGRLCDRVLGASDSGNAALGRSSLARRLVESRTLYLAAH
jgi:hypothetical protein